MNPEVRFRVPTHVYELAAEKSDELGLAAAPGRSGGVSELARMGLYLVLGLPLPQDMHELQAQRYDGVRLARQGLDEALLALRVKHRVDPDYRKRAALQSGQAIPAVATTTFTFAPGEVPPELVDFFVLTDAGVPVGELDLTGGALSEGSLVARRPEASIKELLAAATEIHERRRQEAEKRERRERKRREGEKKLAAWVEKEGSEHVRALREEGFDWLARAELEYCEKRLGGLAARPVSTTQSLSGGAAATRLTPVTQPTLEAIERLREVRAQVRGGEVSLVLEEGRESVLIGMNTPTGRSIHFVVQGGDPPATPRR